jgi:putative phage-type endonuclease
MERIIHSVAQGSEQWLTLRKNYFTASEASAAMGVSKYSKRSDLLQQKASGIDKDVDSFTQGLFDQGHAAEAASRQLAEQILGTDLYPVTVTLSVDGVDLLASLDGATMDEETIWEHKLFNAMLAESVRSGNLDPHYTIQMDQQLLVSGAKRCLFMTSDGTEQNMAWCWYESSQEKFDALIAGWQQFTIDLASHVPVAAEAKPLGRTPETLPALRLEVTGMVTASNLAEFKDHALAVFAGINRELTTDQQFADAEKTVKWCGEVESRLSAAKEHALSQTQSIDMLFKTIDDISAEARSVRLELDKLVTRRKVEIKENIILGGKRAYEQHIASLKEETGGPWIALPVPDFAGAAKGKRTMASIQDGVDTVLANAKIAADASARAIRASLSCLREETAGFEFLFSDKLSLIGKPMDDLKLVIKTRIADHQAAEEKRREEDRARIQAEEEKKAEARVREQAAKEAAEAAVKAAQEAAAAKAAEQPAPVVKQAAPAPAVERAPVSVSRPSPAAHIDPVGSPTLRLGVINERLAPIALSAEGLASLGFTHAATDKAAKLYHESSFPLICAALVRHIEAASSGQKKAA